MADITTYYVAMPFLQDDEGTLVPGTAEECQSPGTALRRADTHELKLVTHVGPHRWRAVNVGFGGEGDGYIGQEVRFHASSWLVQASFEFERA